MRITRFDSQLLHVPLSRPRPPPAEAAAGRLNHIVVLLVHVHTDAELTGLGFSLPQRLTAQGIETVLITGTVTNVCCESSARDAMMLNFRTVMVSDGNAAMTDAEHNATLATFYAIFGDVMDTDFLIGCLERNAGRRAA